MNFKVSVVIPVYNAEKFVRKAVESALNQDETGEVILVEDASPDNALDICYKLATESDKVKVMRHPDKKNHGAAASMNLGINSSAFDYVAILGADDFFLPNRFKKDKEILLSDPSVEGVYNAVESYAIDDFGKARINNKKLLTTMKEFVPAEKLFESMEPIGSLGYFSLDGLTVKKSVFKKTGLLDVKLRLSQDTDISLKMAALCKLVPGNIENPVAYFGLHENNRSQFSQHLMNNRPYLFYELYKWAIQKNLDLKRIFILWQRYFEYSLLNYKLTRSQQIKLLAREIYKNRHLFRSKAFRIFTGNAIGYNSFIEWIKNYRHKENHVFK